jgi:hypothetical protein
MVRARFAMLVLAGLPAAAAADVPGTFVGPGTYATAEGCKALREVAAGTFKGDGALPPTLTTQGFIGLEGTCSFRSVTEVEKGNKWKASLDCHEGAPAGPESDVFERLSDGSIKVTIMGNDTIFVRCDEQQGK